MFNWCPWFIPSWVGIFKAKKVGSWVGLCSTRSKDAFITWPRKPALLLFCQHWAFSAWRLISRTDVVILRYKIGQIPSPVTSTNWSFALIKATLLQGWLLNTMSGFRSDLWWSYWRHWFYVFLTNDFACGLFNILRLVYWGFGRRNRDVVISENKAQRLLGGAAKSESLILTNVSQWKFIHFYFRKFLL